MSEKKRYEYWEDSDTAYDTKIKYGQYFRIIDKKDMVHLLNEQEEQLTTINEFVFTLLNKLDIQDAFIRDYFEIIKNCDLKRMNAIIQE